MESWVYSSFADYLGLRKGTLCDQELDYKLIGFDKEDFIKEAYEIVGENLRGKIFC